MPADGNQRSDILQLEEDWKKKYGGLGVNELRQLKQIVADLGLDKQMLQDVLKKNV